MEGGRSLHPGLLKTRPWASEAPWGSVERVTEQKMSSVECENGPTWNQIAALFCDLNLSEPWSCHL